MRNFFTLVKIEFLGLFDINRAIKTKDKAEKRKLIVFFALMMFATASLVFTSVITNIAFANVFWEQGGAASLKSLQSVMYSMASMLVLLMGIYNVNGVLFGFRDYETLMSMPIKSKTIIASKLAYMYALDLAGVMSVLIPSFVLYGWFTNAAWEFYFLNSILLFFVPLLPMAAAVVIRTLITFISTRVPGKKWFEMIFYFVIVGGIFALNMLGEQQMTAVASATNKNPFAALYVLATCDYNYFAYLGIILSGVIVPALVFFALDKLYKPINSALLNRRSKTNYILKAQKSNKIFPALFKNELKRYFSIPLYVTNTLFGGILAVGMSIFCKISLGKQFAELSSLPPYYLIENLIDRLSGNYRLLLIAVSMLPVLIAAICCTSSTTAAAISIEGKRHWIIKSSPVSIKLRLAAKLMVHYAVFIPPVIISEILVCLLLKTPMDASIMIVVTGICVVLFTGAAGLLINILNPSLQWESEVKPLKQSISVLYSMLACWALCLVLCAVNYLFVINSVFVLATLVTMTVAIVFAFVLILLVFSVGANKAESI